MYVTYENILNGAWHIIRLREGGVAITIRGKRKETGTYIQKLRDSQVGVHQPSQSPLHPSVFPASVSSQT